MQRNIGKLIVLTGFSGSGKDTLMNLVLEKKPNINRVVTHTSRPMRKGEESGVDYHFVPKNVFRDMIDKDKLLEYVLYGSHYKGTSKSEFNRILGGQDIIWRIDMSRAAIIEETLHERLGHIVGPLIVKRTIKILIKTSNNIVALDRYKKREKDKANIKEFEKRLHQDKKIWFAYKDRFPNIIINRTDRLNDALSDILKIIN